MPSSKPLDSETVRQLADILNDTNLTEIEYELGDAKIRVARQIQQIHAAPVAHHVAAPLPMQAAPQALNEAPLSTPPSETPAPVPISQHPGAVKSPMVGNVYLSPAPGTDTFVSIGDSVKIGDSLLIIEAMKVMNQIKSPKDGVVKQILVSDGDPVEYDEVLVVIE